VNERRPNGERVERQAYKKKAGYDEPYQSFIEFFRLNPSRSHWRLHYIPLCSVLSFCTTHREPRPTFTLPECTLRSILRTPLTNDPVRINREIRAKELRVIGADGNNLGVISLAEALKAAEAAGLDLIEISPNAVPPVAKVMDYGKFEYERSKKEKAAKANSKQSETKEVQIKVGTGENDMQLKARKAAEWLADGHRVRAELFLKGRYKGMDEAFLKSRLEKFIVLIPYPYRMAEPVLRSPKGFAGIIERDPKAKVEKKPEQTKDAETQS
jgi:translation initiation factor IF-3